MTVAEPVLKGGSGRQESYQGWLELKAPQGWETHPSSAGGERPPCPVLTIPTGGKKAGQGEKQVRIEV